MPQPPERLFIDTIETPVGAMMAVVDEAERLRVFTWSSRTSIERMLCRRSGAVSMEPRPLPAAVREPVDAYFAGAMTALDSIPVQTDGTAFQRSVWAALRAIPAGATLSYGALATSLGLPKAVRAVGLANGANPVAIILPCHRVIGADGSLTGYGGGLDRKRWLLAHEGARLASAQRTLL